MKFNRQMGGKWLVLPLVLIAGQAWAGDAETPTVPAGVSTYGQLDALRSQNALLAETIKNAELKSKLKSGGTAASPAAAPGFPGQVTPPPVAPFPGVQAASAPAPAPKAKRKADDAPAALALVAAEVQMVSTDKDSRLVALLSLEGGRQVKARVGSTIPGVGTVLNISADEVVVLPTKGKAISLPFGSEPTNLPTNSSSPTPMAPMPSMMGMPSLSTVMPPIPRGGR